MERYARRFGFNVPTKSAGTAAEELDRLMKQAIRDVVPLDASRLYAIQGMSGTPSDVLY